jgi:hypothetical protein
MTGILGNILPFEGVGHGLGQDQIITRERSSYEMEGLIPFFIIVCVMQCMRLFEHSGLAV